VVHEKRKLKVFRGGRKKNGVGGKRQGKWVVGGWGRGTKPRDPNRFPMRMGEGDQKQSGQTPVRVENPNNSKY